MLIVVGPDGDVEILDTPATCDVVGGVEDIDAEAFDGAASVEDGDGERVIVAWDGDDGAEGEESRVGGDEFHGVGVDGVA